MLHSRIIGHLSIVPDNHKILAKFHSSTLRIMDPMRLMSLFLIIASTSIGIHLTSNYLFLKRVRVKLIEKLDLDDIKTHR